MPPPDSVSTFSQAACAPSTPPFAPSGGDLLRLGALGTVFAATDGGMAGQQNSGFGLDVVGPDGRLFRKMFVTFSTHDDHPEVEQTDAVVSSDDGATTICKSCMSTPREPIIRSSRSSIWTSSSRG
jgi:hypothetical protein